MTTLDNRALDNDLLAQAYDAEQAGDLIRAVELRALYHSGQQASIDQAAPAVQVEHWQSEKGATYTDFTIGDGLTKVLIGSEGANKPGVELAIGKNCINTRLDEVITLADVRRLRDNLTALLNDPRLAGEQAAAPPIRIERLYYDQSKRGDLSADAQSGPLAYVDYYAGAGDTEVVISFNVGGTHAPEVELIGRTGSLDSVLAMVANLHTLLADPRVQAARAASEQPSAPTMKKAPSRP